MSETSSGRQVIAFGVLALGQLAAWGSVGFLAVAAPSIAAELGISTALAFAGNTVFYLAMALAGPLFGSLFIRHGAGPVMSAGAMVLAIGFLALGNAANIVSYMAFWLVLGLGGAACLTTAAHILLNEIHGSKAAGAIGGLMILTGLSSTVFLPLAAGLIAMVGWRSRF